MYMGHNKWTDPELTCFTNKSPNLKFSTLKKKNIIKKKKKEKRNQAFAFHKYFFLSSEMNSEFQCYAV